MWQCMHWNLGCSLCPAHMPHRSFCSKKHRHRNGRQGTTHRNRVILMPQPRIGRAGTRPSSQPTLNLPCQNGLRGMRRNSWMRASSPSHNVLQGRVYTQRRHQGSSGHAHKPGSLRLRGPRRKSRHGQCAPHTSQRGTAPKPALCPARPPDRLALSRKKYNRARMRSAFARCALIINRYRRRPGPRPRCAANTFRNCRAAGDSTASCMHAW